MFNMNINNICWYSHSYQNNYNSTETSDKIFTLASLFALSQSTELPSALPAYSTRVQDSLKSHSFNIGILTLRWT